LPYFLITLLIFVCVVSRFRVSISFFTSFFLCTSFHSLHTLFCLFCPCIFLSLSLYLGTFFFLVIDFMHSASSIIDLKIACSTNYCFADNFVSCIGNVAFCFWKFQAFGQCFWIVCLCFLQPRSRRLSAAHFCLQLKQHWYRSMN